ncbi:MULTISPECIES: mycothiol synthase [unclassified Corynebacterium]|uniref:mycothiol synthase n=1 Tax=unclassified Corynebacterium TaxID=2624378 RepID=UPI0030A07BF2
MDLNLQHFPSVLSGDSLNSARRLLVDATAQDRVEPFGEAFVRGLSEPQRGHQHVAVFSADQPGQCIALAGIAPDSIELVVHPAFRRRGVGQRLLQSVDEIVVKPGRLPIWAHGNLPGAQQLAAVTGRKMNRQLLQMSIEGESLDLAAEGGEVPDGIELETYAELEKNIGREAADSAWLAVNNEAFDWHPEQGNWTQGDLDLARSADWFDSAGVFFAVDRDSREVVGFHWTKMHPEQEERVGEVYVIGLAERARGRGVGAWLTRIGLKDLVARGAGAVILYVEGGNATAIRTYEKTGFELARMDVMYG